METKLVRGRALLIIGEPGTGKSTLAWTLAKGYGSFTLATMCDLQSRFSLGNLLMHEPDTIVLDEYVYDENHMAYLKSLIANSEIEIERRGHDVSTVKTPNIIICCTSANAPVLDKIDRRFNIVNLPITDKLTPQG